MEYFTQDQNFKLLVDKLSQFNIDIKEDKLNHLYTDLKLYVDKDENGFLQITPNEYFLDLAIRELGNIVEDSQENIEIYLSDDVVTFVFENYFSESRNNTLSKILLELRRITKGNLDCKVISESVYDEENEKTSIDLEFSVKDKDYRITHHDKFEDGTLTESFMKNELLPKLEGSITKGNLLFVCQEWIQFIYFENESDYELFSKSINYYTDINNQKKENPIKTEILKEEGSPKKKKSNKKFWWQRLCK